MPNPLLLLVCLLLFACADKKKEVITKAIQTREQSKGHQLQSYTILRTVDSLGVLKVYYSVKLVPGSAAAATSDSIIFYELGDGLLQPQP
jgi:hypothetical protein